MKKTLLAVSLALFSSQVLANFSVVPPQAYASVADYNGMVSQSSYGRVQELCPESTPTYAAKLDEIDVEGAPYLADKFWAPLITPIYNEVRLPVELCFELKSLKADYDWLLANNISANDAVKSGVNTALNDLNTCLKAAVKRSEIENCSVAFRQTVSSLIGL